jgi:RNA polymerase sigma-70 factor (ECF subfamily)
MSNGQSDNDLWIGVKNNHQDSLAQLFQRYYFFLIKTGFNYTPDVELAKDAVNDVFFNLWRTRHTLSDVGNIKAYLTTTFRNHLFSLLRQNVKNRNRLDDWQLIQEDSERSYEELLLFTQLQQEQKEKLRRALSSLTPRQKEYLHLKFYEGLGYEQIAEKTGQAIKTVYNTVYEAIKQLRQEITL